MVHDDEWDSDEDGNPEYLGPAKEEPDCPPCGDSGREHFHRLGRWWSIRCRSCDPNRLAVALAAIRRRLPTLHRPAATGDEPPF